MPAGVLIQALLPVALLIALGHLLFRSRLLAPEGWIGIERLVYFLLFPALLFLELARADLAGRSLLALGCALLLGQLAMAAMAEGLRRRLALPGPAHTSVLQCVVRFNSYVALALAPALLGSGAGPLMALAVAVMVPTANFLSVAALARHGAGRAEEGGVRPFLKALAQNPLILACLAGIGFGLSGLELPQVMGDTLGMLGRATLALGLLTVGAGLRLEGMRGRVPIVLATTAGSLLVKPLLVLVIGHLLGLAGTGLGVAVLASAVPTATSAYILARIMGGDAELMAALITSTTLASLVTLPLLMAWLV